MPLSLNKNCIWVLALCLFLSLYWVQGRVGLGPGNQEWDYVEVRNGSHLFYWLLYTTANVRHFTHRPLVIWLQGGPGVASSGIGFFEQLGPIDIEGRLRETSWVHHVNVLIVDSPVGTGFAYVEDHGSYATTNRRIALDLVELMKQFLEKYPAFRNVPLHIFSESYGGKMAPEFALELHSAKKRGQVDCRLESVVVGNPWTSPLDSVLSYAPYLLQMGIVDEDGYRRISRLSGQLAALVYDKQWLKALRKASDVQDEISASTGNVFIYNTQRRVHEDEVYRYGEDKKMSDFMRTNVTRVLGLEKMPVWMDQNSTVFESLYDDLFKPATHIVTRLLEETPIKVGIFSGTLDLLCATPGTVNWINRLKWSRRSEYARAHRTAFRIDGMLEGYEKHGGRLSMFWVLRAGHLVQQDNPAAMAYILKYFTEYE
ncbi:LOW QUALITY PROTEIN: retinoid-inducible serine carboxypeptidase [Drosophila ficusphila]|uniref:LOW QUALITY PROTEIN: retinoid-inducible serine carboxypeptidase n=1 Tax=Drosophila ficusphila TaxID=30025 RepID=UPI0007E5C2F9|nr:LOW QUALITY PROTEIN: retinoid-inducible serine carboxypeptidase [Drosophila ficusphila]